jgi:peptide/nickel transport system permease protein
MRNYLIRRIPLMIPTLFLVTIVVFLTVRLIPGNVIEMMAIEHASTAGGEQLDLEAIREWLGMNTPWHIQYARWIKGIIMHGDFGNSLWTQRSVTSEIISRIPITFELGVMAFIIAQLVALPIGIYSAIRQDSVGDYIGRSFAIICIAVPGFWLGTMIMVFPSIWWGWSPQMKYIPFVDDPMTNLGQFIIPAFLMGMAMSATTMRMLRTTMLEVLRQDYVRTAWSKGLRERIVIIRHGVRNALIPVVTVISGQIPVMIGGAVIMEQIFSLPGMGRLFLDSIMRRDYPFVSGINILLATIGMVIILLTDLSYAYLDPRVRYQ